MPTYVGLKPSSELVILPKCIGNSPIDIFEMPHPSNNTLKQPIKLFIHDNVVYQLQTKRFSHGSPYNQTEDDITDKYHYTADGQTYKSIVVVNKENPDEGIIVESGDFDYHTKYDLTYSLCRFYYRADVVSSEAEYCKENISLNIKPDSKYLTLRDFQDLLVDSDGSHWSRVPVDVLKVALEKICYTIEEAGEIYFKIVPEKMCQWVATRIPRILDVFPTSLPIPKDIPEEYLRDIQICWAVNLMISLLPRGLYWNLRKYTGPEVNVKLAFERMETYNREVVEKNKENQILIKAAMSVGLNHGSQRKQDRQSNSSTKPKLSNNKKKVAVGNGLIDGFFKKR
ncbi:HHR049Wp [Eremothecium sinecaudum]|uniref:Ribonuclease H2 subunit B n=1 Tax=Eremothecium sinecaudum TaxID=45286 RepID=A0A109V129_9SACH|nr:HHR049Wp [Eremothecium sinecaudum]AMD22818.1 HHR049Wp [Eremothecium sinecaudum]